jgi:SAM-dependent methyltransferase
LIPQDVLDFSSQLCLNDGRLLLQGFRMASTDAGHIAALLDLMRPAPNTLWADIGSGFGEAARLMCEARPDLSFFLINNNQFQIDHSPPDFRAINADMHDLPFGDASVDGCMFLWSLCHADDLPRALREAARVTVKGGQLFVFDYARVKGDNALMRDYLFASAHPLLHILTVLQNAGWRMDLAVLPGGSDDVFRGAAEDSQVYARIVSELKPIVWRAVKL